MSILNSVSVTFNTSEYKNNTEYHKKIKGHQLSFFARHSGFLSPSHSAIIAEFANLAGATDEYMIRRSYADMSVITGRSISTVRRAFTEATKCGMLVKQHQVASNNAQVCNVYRFTTQFLHFIHVAMEIGSKQGIKFANATKLVKQLISKVSYFFETGNPLFKLNKSPHVQNEQPIENKSHSIAKRRERSCAVQPKASPADSSQADNGLTVIREEHTNHCLAAAKARAAKRRSDEGYAKRQALYRTAEKLAKKFAWLRSATTVNKPKRSSALDFSMDYSASQGCATINEAFDLMKQRGYRSEFDREDWSIPEGFRG
ncbi:lytic replication protein [Escherichia coli]|nr:lytic replication protein [Escherichia coli]EII4798471.1 lytic replication protein [Escherichia coli]HBA9494683.1 lytic replication protein [Escherichia coli]HBA9564882.1 lytic replication protein [Escherichia coli]HBA9617070.1 lytic replication protein [Escherichia coli]